MRALIILRKKGESSKSDAILTLVYLDAEREKGYWTIL